MGILSNIFKSVEQGKIEARQEAQRSQEMNAAQKAAVDKQQAEMRVGLEQAYKDGNKAGVEYYQKWLK
ncbi:MAG: hypothetical protein WCN95_13050 [bacterium]